MKKAFFFTILFLAGATLYAQGGGELGKAMQKVNSDLQALPGYMKTFLNIMALIIGGYGVIRVYSKHQNGDQDTQKAMAQYGFSFVFVIVARLLVDTIFGVA